MCFQFPGLFCTNPLTMLLGKPKQRCIQINQFSSDLKSELSDTFGLAKSCKASWRVDFKRIWDILTLDSLGVVFADLQRYRSNPKKLTCACPAYESYSCELWRKTTLVQFVRCARNKTQGAFKLRSDFAHRRGKRRLVFLDYSCISAGRLRQPQENLRFRCPKFF